MKWTNHKMLTGAIVYAVTGNPLSAVVSAIGSVIPDAVEGFPDESNYNAWQKSHRKGSHLAPVYLVTFLLCQAYIFIHPLPTTFYQVITMAKVSMLGNLPIVAWFIGMLSLGACFHIVEDALCGKVPGLTLKQRVGVKLFYVGSAKEYLFVWPVSLALLFIRLKVENLI